MNRRERRLVEACRTFASLAGRSMPRRCGPLTGPAGTCPDCDGPLDAEFVHNGVGEQQVTPAACDRCGGFYEIDHVWHAGELLEFHRKGSTRDRRSRRMRRARRAYWARWGAYDREKFGCYRRFLAPLKLTGHGFAQSTLDEIERFTAEASAREHDDQVDAIKYALAGRTGGLRVA